MVIWLVAIWQVFYTVDIASKGWKGGKGYISEDMIVKGLPHPSEDTLILVGVFLVHPQAFW